MTEAPFQHLAKEAHGGSAIAARLDQDVEEVAVLVHGPPQILLSAVDRHEDFIQIPRVAQLASSAPQLPRVVESESLTPVADCFVRDGDASLREQIFHITEAQAEAVIEPDRVADDLGLEAVSAVAGRLARHRPTLPAAAST